MNNIVPIKPRTAPLTQSLLESARKQASWHEDQGRPGSAVLLRLLVSEIEDLREAALGAVVVVNQANAALSLSQLKASVLLMAAEKAASFIDAEIEQRQCGGEVGDWAALTILSNELHAAIKVAKG